MILLASSRTYIEHRMSTLSYFCSNANVDADFGGKAFSHARLAGWQADGGGRTTFILMVEVSGDNACITSNVRAFQVQDMTRPK